MNAIKRNIVLGLCLLAFLSVGQVWAQKKAAKTDKSSETVIYVVRHAEKAASSGAMTDDPELSEAGRKRTEILRDKLLKEPVAAFFATKYKRTQQTVQPLADAKKQPVQTYHPTDFAGLAQNIRQNYAGKTVVIAGHSNTVLPIIEALGGKKPVAEIPDYQYDQLFKVTLREGQEPQVDVQVYGLASLAPTY
ncbi:MAG: SixA phosphatase family protein [Rufibacter sp.]